MDISHTITLARDFLSHVPPPSIGNRDEYDFDAIYGLAIEFLSGIYDPNDIDFNAVATALTLYVAGRIDDFYA